MQYLPSDAKIRIAGKCDFLHNSAISTCLTGEEWEKALQHLRSDAKTELQASVISYITLPLVLVGDLGEEWEKVLQHFCSDAKIRIVGKSDVL